MREEVGFVFETTEESDGGGLRPFGYKLFDVESNLSTGGDARSVIKVTKAFAHGLAKRGFVMHEFEVLSSLGVDGGAAD